MSSLVFANSNWVTHGSICLYACQQCDSVAERKTEGKDLVDVSIICTGNN